MTKYFLYISQIQVLQLTKYIVLYEVTIYNLQFTLYTLQLTSYILQCYILQFTYYKQQITVTTYSLHLYRNTQTHFLHITPCTYNFYTYVCQHIVLSIELQSTSQGEVKGQANLQMEITSRKPTKSQDIPQKKNMPNSPQNFKTQKPAS